MTTETETTAVKKKLNVRMLERVKEVILEEPKRIKMDKWLTSLTEVPEKKRPMCNTVGCIAGWVVALKLRKRTREKIYEALGLVDDYDWDFAISSKAQEILGLTDVQANLLFDPHSWPEPYVTRYGNRTYSYGTKKYAQLVAARIDHMIKTGE